MLTTIVTVSPSLAPEPAIGLCSITVPLEALLLYSSLTNTLSLLFLIVSSASLLESPTTSGTFMTLDFVQTTILTLVPFLTFVPSCGVCSRTLFSLSASPFLYVISTTSPSLFIFSTALSIFISTTFIILKPLEPFETTSFIFIPSVISVPYGILCDITRPFSVESLYS